MATVVINDFEDFIRNRRHVTNKAMLYDGNGLIQTLTVTVAQRIGTADTTTETWVKTFTWVGGLCTNETGFVLQ